MRQNTLAPGCIGVIVCSWLRDLPERIKNTSFVHRIWGGQIRSRVVCSRCRKPSDTFDSFLDLSLDCGKRTLVGMLQGFVKEDHLEGDNKYHCEK